MNPWIFSNLVLSWEQLNLRNHNVNWCSSINPVFLGQMLQKSWNFAILDDRKIAENSLFQRTGICCKMYWILFFYINRKNCCPFIQFFLIFPRNFSFRHRWKGGGGRSTAPPPIYATARYHYISTIFSCLRYKIEHLPKIFFTFFIVN